MTENEVPEEIKVKLINGPLDGSEIDIKSDFWKDKDFILVPYKSFKGGIIVGKSLKGMSGIARYDRKDNIGIYNKTLNSEEIENLED